MATDLVKTNSESTPSLPRSLDALLDLVGSQRRAGERRITIPRALVPSEVAAAHARLRWLNARIDAPRGGADATAEVARLIAGFSVTSNLSDTQAAAKAETYGDAIDDVPAWAIIAARRAWARGETSALKGKVDPSFPPAPAHVRALALEAMAPVVAEASRLRALLDADVKAPMSEAHRSAMLQRLSRLTRPAELPDKPRDLTQREAEQRIAAMRAAVEADRG